MQAGRRKLVLVLAGLGLAAAAGAFAYVRQMAEAPEPTSAERLALGRTVYEDHCAACHGTNLEGQPNWRRRGADGLLPAPPHDETGHTWHHPDAQLFAMTKHGSAALAGPDYKTAMVGFGEVLSDREIWAVLAYIRSRWPANIRARQAAITARQAN